MTVSITADEILAHPRFAEARTAHVDALVQLFTANPIARQMMADAGVIVFRGFLVGFHVASKPNDRTTWATPGNVRRALIEQGSASPRRIDDLLARFRQAGYVESVPAPDDRRVVILIPTAQTIAHDRDHLATYHRFLLDLYPGRGYEWVLGSDERAHLAIRVAAVRHVAQATMALRHEAIGLFLARTAGYLALLLAMRAQLAGSDTLTWSSMSDDLGVARSHLRTLFSEAEGKGYVRLRSGQGRPIEILMPLWNAYDRFLAEIEAGQDAIAQAAFADFK